MNNCIYIYTNNKSLVLEISDFPLDNTDNLVVHEVPMDLASEILRLKKKWDRNARAKLNKVFYDRDKYSLKKGIYIYYHFKDGHIKSITPRLQETMELDEELKSGLFVIDDLIEDFVNGDKNMLNYKVIEKDNSLELKKIVVQTSNDYLTSIALIEDYAVGVIEDDSFITVSNTGGALSFRCTNEEYLGKIVKLFIVNKYDKTELFDTIELMFFSTREYIIPINTYIDYFIISPSNNIINYIG